MRKQRDNSDICVRTEQINLHRYSKIGILMFCVCLICSYVGMFTPVTVKAQGKLGFAGKIMEADIVAEKDVTVEEFYVYDRADLLSEEEEMDINEQILSVIETTGWNVAAVTIDNAQGLSSAKYADTFYDEWAGIDTDGFLVLIDMDNREIYISTSGIAIRYLYDTRIENILDEGYYYISDGEYADCLGAMISTAEYYYYEGIPEDQYNYNVETGAVSEYRVLTWMEVVPVLLLAAFVGVGIYWGVSKRYSIKGGSYDYPLMKYGRVNLVSKEDHFIRKNITHQRIPKNPDNGGPRSNGGGGGHRSSVHSSGGGSHGGGGRKF